MKTKIALDAVDKERLIANVAEADRWERGSARVIERGILEVDFTWSVVEVDDAIVQRAIARSC